MKFALQSQRISRRYANALYSLGADNNNVDELLNDFIFIDQTLKISAELKEFIANPHHPDELYEAVTNDLFKNNVKPLTYDFLLFLIRKGRLNILNDIIAAFFKLYHEHHNISKIQIISAAALLPEQVDAICKKLKARWKHEYLAENIIDPSLIGGFQVKSGDKVLDLSMKTQLENFRRQVINA